MTTFSLQFTIPDAQVNRALTALRQHFGPVIEQVTTTDPNTGVTTTTDVPRDMTNAEIMARLRKMTADHIKAIMAAVEADNAAKAARLDVQAIDIQ